MNKSDLLHYKNLLLSKRQELSTGKSLVDSISTAGELRGDPVDMATSETDAATQIRLHQTDGKLLRAIEDALTRVRHEEFGICEECRQPIGKARLEAVPWTRWCRDCKERQDSQC
jgi:DnaK suppressor protein